MSSNALEKALWQIGSMPGDAQRFRDDAAAYARQFRLDAVEHDMLVHMHVAAMARRDVSTLLLSRAFRTVYGPQSAGEYRRRISEPADGVE